MKRMTLGIVLALAAATACGEGRAIFNVDLHSFLLADGADTMQYVLPPPGGTLQQATQVPLLGGLQDSGVEELQFTATLRFENTAGGPGTIAFKLYFDTTQATLFAGRAADSLTSPVGPGATVNTVTQTFNVTSTLKDLFVYPTIFVGLRIVVDNPSVSVIQGQVRVTAFDMRLVIQEQVF
ncbi:MAG TPA: hypothetical protein VGA20_01970 [Gemmatimonadales bacterium]